MEKLLLKGNEALAESALRAGCRFYAGYPITPQSEILEYMSKHMEKRGGVFIQGESEVASISMIWGAAATGTRSMTSSSGPGFSLKQEGIAYLASYGMPSVIVSVMRYGIGGGDITQGQDSYLQATKGGGNGDYRLLTLAPNSVQECAQFAYEAFDLAEKYRNPVLILSDGAIGQMVEPCVLPEPKEHNIDSYDWIIKGRSPEENPVKVTNLNWYWGDKAWEEHVIEKYTVMTKEQQRWESYQTEDAELIFVAFGVSSRVCKKAVQKARKEGIKLGLIRPISLWPYPKEAFKDLPKNLKGFMSVQMDITAQMVEDIYIADKFKHPVYAYSTAIAIPEVDKVLEMAKKALSGELEPKEVF